MVLLILVVIWAVVLIMPMLRARAESSPADSIGDFHRQLRVLQRTRPGWAPRQARGDGPQGTGPQAGSVGPPVRPRPIPVVGQRPRVAPSQGQVRAAPAPVSAGDASARRARTVRRRRDVLFALLMGMGTTFVMAMVLSGPALWALHLLIDGLFVGYLGLLVRMRNLAAEREMKLRFLPTPPPRPEPATLLLRRSAN